jgi:hypothetical protein
MHFQGHAFTVRFHRRGHEKQDRGVQWHGELARLARFRFARFVFVDPPRYAISGALVSPG